MQLAVVEFSRNVLGLERANSREFDDSTAHPVIDLMEAQKEITMKGGTMRLGAYPCSIRSGTLAHRIYGKTEISERHRHRYEVNSAYLEQLSGGGLVPSGFSPDGKLCETVELADHPWFFACQFHPEYKSKPTAPHPIFERFVEAALQFRTLRLRNEEAAAEEQDLAGSVLPSAPGGVSAES
jgi:CTP synthase